MEQVEDLKQDKVEVKTEDKAVPRQSEQQQPEQYQPLTDENKEFAQMVTDATTTKEQIKESEQAEKQAQALRITPEEASQYAMIGLKGMVDMVGESTGAEIKLPKLSVMAYSALLTPCIMKYGASIKDMLSNIDDIPEDSYWPEMMAVGGVAAVGLPVFNQVRKHKKQGGDDGDKSKQSAQSEA